MSQKGLFSEKEIKIAKMKLENMKNKDIARKLGVSSSDVSQTIKRIVRKTKTVKDSIELMEVIGLAHKGPSIELTAKGEKLVNTGWIVPQPLSFTRVSPIQTKPSTFPTGPTQIDIQDWQGLLADVQEVKAVVSRLQEKIIDQEKIKDMIRAEIVSVVRAELVATEKETLRVTTSYERERATNWLSSWSLSLKPSVQERYLSSVHKPLLGTPSPIVSSLSLPMDISKSVRKKPHEYLEKEGR